MGSRQARLPPDVAFPRRSSSISHVEVLLDGAAAQYGTDAVAGVVNIILKNKSSGGQLSATAGEYYNKGGFTGGNESGSKGESYDVSYNMGVPLFDKGFVNFTVDKSFKNFTQLGGCDERMCAADNSLVPQNTVTSVGANGVANLSTVGNGIPGTLQPGQQGYPRTNSIDGNPQVQMTLGELNAGYDFSDNLQLYAFGTIGHKFGKSFENYRLPNQIVTTMGSSQPCSATNPDGYNTGSSTANGLTASCTGPFALDTANGFSALPGTTGAGLNPATGTVISSGQAGNLFSSSLINAQTGARLPTATGEPLLGTAPELVLYPNGFRPMEVLKEDDYQYNTGMKFNVAGWAMDANVGYGKDINKIYTWNSGVRSLFIDTHTTPTNFYDGSFTASQFTGSLDATLHPFNVGMASPLTVAVGLGRRVRTFMASALASSFPITRKARNPSRASRSPAPAITAARIMRVISTSRWRRSRPSSSTLRAAPNIIPTSATPRSARSLPVTISARNGRSAAPSRPVSAPRPWRRNSIPPSTSRRLRPPCNCRPTPRRPTFWAFLT